MPKVKTNSAAKKRFKKTGTDQIVFAKAFRRHLLTCKSRKTKRNLRRKGYLLGADRAHILKALPY